MVEDSGKNDVVIIGGGAAGMSAALWCAELGFGVSLVESSPRFGGQLWTVHNAVRNYLGGDFENGDQVISAFESSISRFQFKRLTSRKVINVDLNGRSVLYESGNELAAKAIVVATGVRRRALNVPGEIEFQKKGILESGTNEKESVTGKRVAVIGGGDAALENALILAEVAERVLLIHRRNMFSARREFIERIQNHPVIETLSNTIVDRFDGVEALTAIKVTNEEQPREIKVDHAIVRIGVEPNSEVVGSLVETDLKGYIVVDAECRTSAVGIWAIGDVANPIAPTISTAVGMGATCAKSIEKFIRRNE